MRSNGTLWAVAVLAGCQSFETVDDACVDRLRGEEHTTEVEADALSRITCYRRLVGLSPARAHPATAEAGQRHAAYLETHELATDPAQWAVENAGLPGFSGQTAIDRVRNAGFDPSEIDDFEVQEILVPLGQTPARDRGVHVDELMESPFARDLLLAPHHKFQSWSELVDPGTDERFAYVQLAMRFPSAKRAGRPVHYPADGQREIPAWWVVTDRVTTSELESLPPVAGFPISLTVNSATQERATSNPLDLFVEDSVIEGPGGDLEHVVVLPGAYVGGTLRATVLLVPVQPLEQGARYFVDATLSWRARDSKHVSFGFEVSGEPLDLPPEATTGQATADR